MCVFGVNALALCLESFICSVVHEEWVEIGFHLKFEVPRNIEQSSCLGINFSIISLWKEIWINLWVNYKSQQKSQSPNICSEN